MSFTADASARDFDRVEYVCDYGLDVRAFVLGADAKRDAVAQDGARDVSHVVGRDEVAPAHRGERLRAQEQRDARARARAVSDRRVLARAAHYVDEVAAHAVFGARGPDFGAAAHDGLVVGKRPHVYLVEPTRVEPCVPVPDDARLLLGRRVRDDYLQKEAVELRLRQRVRALVLDVVLGREYGEERRYGLRLAVDCDLALLHRFE